VKSLVIMCAPYETYLQDVDLKKRQNHLTQSTPTFQQLRHNTPSVFIVRYFPCLLVLSMNTFHCYVFLKWLDICTMRSILSPGVHSKRAKGYPAER
ncbi:hypothetical protein GOODEAATRI_002348, partial [Goodea atripinnis]